MLQRATQQDSNKNIIKQKPRESIRGIFVLSGKIFSCEIDL